MQPTNTSNYNSPVTIPLSKVKMVLVFIAALAFVAIGVWLITSPDQFTGRRISSPLVIQIFGGICTLFFLLCAVIAVIRLVKTSPGLVLDEQGVNHYGIGSKPTFMAWQDITELKVIEVGMQKMIMVAVQNPEHYMERASNSLTRKMMQTNQKMYGAPFALSASAFKINTDELFALLKGYRANYQLLKGKN